MSTLLAKGMTVEATRRSASLTALDLSSGIPRQRSSQVITRTSTGIHCGSNFHRN